MLECVQPSQHDNRYSTLGAIIRRQREVAAQPIRQFASAVGISGPYLSQIERGLRAPSEAVLNAIATSLQTTSEALYAEAGYLPPEDGDEQVAGEVLEAVERDPALTAPQRRALAEIYQSFLDANFVRRRRS